MNYRHTVCVLTIFMSCPVNADTGTAYSPIIATINTDTSARPAEGEYCGALSHVTLKDGLRVVLIGERECKSKHWNDTTSYYEVAAFGHRRLVSKDSLDIPNIEQQIIPKLSNDDISQAISLSDKLWQEDRSELDKEMARHRKAGLTILNASISDVSEYTQGTSFSISVKNPTKKPIKYIWLTIVGFNAVNDPVRDSFKRTPEISVKAIGPIEENMSGSYHWEYLWLTDIVESFKIRKIKVQYMDGSIKTISDAKSIFLSRKSLMVLPNIDASFDLELDKFKKENESQQEK